MEKTAKETRTAGELVQAHASLQAELTSLEQMLLDKPEASTRAVLTQLASTHGQITNHFGCEEQNGWMGAVRKREPRLEHSVQHLVEEHRQLVESLDTLIDEVESKTSLDDTVRQKALRWIGHVRDHEARVNELLEDAFIEDLGAGD